MAGVKVIDLAGSLREAQQQGKGGLYYPNDGHLSFRRASASARLIGERLLP